MVFCCSRSESDWNWKWNVDSQKCIVLSAVRRKRLPQFSLSESFSSWKKLDFFHAVFICQCLNPCCPDLGLPSWAGWWFWQLACHFQTGFGVWEPQGNKLIHRSQNWQIMELKVQNSSKVVTSAGGARRSPPKCSVSTSVVAVWLLNFQYLNTRAGEQTFGSNLLTWKCDFIILARMGGVMALLERPLLIMMWHCNSIVEWHVQ